MSSRSLIASNTRDQLLARAPVLRVHGRAIEGDGGDAVGDIEAELRKIHGLSRRPYCPYRTGTRCMVKILSTEV